MQQTHSVGSTVFMGMLDTPARVSADWVDASAKSGHNINKVIDHAINTGALRVLNGEWVEVSDSIFTIAYDAQYAVQYAVQMCKDSADVFEILAMPEGERYELATNLIDCGGVYTFEQIVGLVNDEVKRALWGWNVDCKQFGDDIRLYASRYTATEDEPTTEDEAVWVAVNSDYMFTTIATRVFDEDFKRLLNTAEMALVAHFYTVNNPIDECEIIEAVNRFNPVYQFTTAQQQLLIDRLNKRYLPGFDEDPTGGDAPQHTFTNKQTFTNEAGVIIETRMIEVKSEQWDGQTATIIIPSSDGTTSYSVEDIENGGHIATIHAPRWLIDYTEDETGVHATVLMPFTMYVHLLHEMGIMKGWV